MNCDNKLKPFSPSSIIRYMFWPIHNVIEEYILNLYQIVIQYKYPYDLNYLGWPYKDNHNSKDIIHISGFLVDLETMTPE